MSMAKRVLVVGAAGGVGLAVTELLLANGCSVIGSVMDEDQRRQLIDAHPAIDQVFVMDLADADGIATKITANIDSDSTLDAVAVCAGIATYGPLETTPLTALRHILEVNTVADLAVFQATMPQLRRARGRMVLISSLAGKVSFPFIGHYSASKFALEALADAMRREVAPWGVSISLVEPGGIRTPMAAQQLAAISADCDSMSGPNRDLYGHLFRAHRDAVSSIGQSGLAPEEVAAAVWAALSESNPRTRYETGTDSVLFCGLARTRSDEELDKLASIEATVPHLTHAEAAS